jgi:hypothetical protein
MQEGSKARSGNFYKLEGGEQLGCSGIPETPGFGVNEDWQWNRALGQQSEIDFPENRSRLFIDGLRTNFT